METKTLLNALSPQLQALVEASLGAKLPDSTIPTTTKPKLRYVTNNKAEIRPTGRHVDTSANLNPSELFALKHPEAPGVVVKDGFLGRQNALAVRDAFTELAQSETFHAAKVGAGENLRNDETVRGDRIVWIPTPKGGEKNVNPVMLHLRKQVESLVYGLKKVSPEMDLRNIVSTQFAIFPGDGARFVKHFDTYSNAQRDDKSKDGLVRLITCVYYLNDEWETEHGGQLRVHLKESQVLPASKWDISPKLDTLVVFRSLDVEHEVLPTYCERKAVTIWYYGKPPASSSLQLKLARSTDISIPHSFPTATDNQLSHSQKAAIFIAIPSYRDSECRHTVDDLLTQATCPGRLSIGICLQVDEEDDTRAFLESKYSTSKIRMLSVDYRVAAGPCVARAQAQKLWQGEEYYLQIDSHMRFRPGWDCFLISELGKCSSTKSILTTYPLGYTLPNLISDECRPTLLCASSFDENGMLRQTSKLLATKSTKPLASLFWAAGFAFSSAKVIAEVPYDETLRFLFFGEEPLMAARLWTSGWDFFTPSETVVYHLWTRAYRPVFQELESEETRACRAASTQFVKSLLHGDENTERRELGTVRSFESYQKHVGVDFTTKKIEWRSEWGNLDPIQFDLKAHTGKTLTPA